MLLKAVLLALGSLLGGLGTLQASALLESYALLALGVVLTMAGVLSLSSTRHVAKAA
ncbi:MAG: hypothetical protein ACPHID_02105 [Thermoplasmatota archaeon]